MLRSRRLLIFAMILILLSLASCSQGDTTKDQNDKLTIAVSIVPQAAFVEKVAGDLVEIVTLIPPGNNPENYQPKPKDIASLSIAAQYFTVGVPAEEGIVSKAADLNPNLEIIHLEDVVGAAYPDLEISKEGRDPHIWVSPKRAIVMVESIRDNLVRIDADHASVYKRNAQAYISELKAVDAEIKQIIRETQQKAFLIYHPSLGYFADDYGLEMVSIEEDGKEATTVRLKEVIDFAKKNNIQVIFYQVEHDKTQAQTIAEEIGGKVEEIEPLSYDYVGNLRKMAGIFREVLN
ncbi:MAG: zinc ABC transporter solute-binding protein [Eubacteriaceae bacterium]|nr:zinc ABC transporter solute-binding protein [Eubacteriaceae bacterium]